MLLQNIPRDSHLHVLDLHVLASVLVKIWQGRKRINKETNAN
jgi:hypothetical protein